MRFINRLPFVAVIFLALCACKNPVADSANGVTSPEPTAHAVGSLTLGISVISPYIQNSSAPVSRAYLYATSVTVSVQTSSGTNVVTPVSQTLSLSNTTGSTTSTLSAIPNIPVGTGYRIIVDIYSSASGTAKLVSGTATGVAIAEGVSTPVSVTCTPSTPTSLSFNTDFSPSLAATGEAWYSFSAIANQLYAIQAPFPTAYLFLFDSTGTLVSDCSSASYNLTPTAAGTYYLGVAAGAAAVAPTIRVNAIFNEGSVASPVSVALDTNRTFKLGNVTGQTYSYYGFTTTTAGTYYFVSPSSVSYYSTLYSDSAFSTTVKSSTYANGEYALTGLSAATTYYWRLQNNNGANLNFTGRLVSPTAAAAETYNEGSIASPVTLTLGTARNATFGGHSWNRNSYYTFTTGPSPAPYLLHFGTFPSTLPYIYYYLGTDATFASYNTSNSTNSSDLNISVLAANTTYYLRLMPSSSYPFDSQATLAVTLSARSCIELSIGANASAAYTAGSIASGQLDAWYHVSLLNSNGSTFRINWDNAYNGSGTYTLYTNVSAYRGNGTSYFTGMSSGYGNNYQQIVVPSGEADAFIRVLPAYSGDTGSFGVRFIYPPTGSIVVTVH
jgi:hypothetical protein